MGEGEEARERERGLGYNPIYTRKVERVLAFLLRCLVGQEGGKRSRERNRRKERTKERKKERERERERISLITPQ